AAASPINARSLPGAMPRDAGASGSISAVSSCPATAAAACARHVQNNCVAPPMKPAMRGNPALGMRYLLRGAQMLAQPGIRRFVVLPLLVNLLVFGALVTAALQQFGIWIDQVLAWLPEWLAFLEWIIWPLSLVLLLVVVIYSFSVLANLIAAPFNGLLAEKVELLLGGQVPDGGGFGGAIKDAPRAIGKELRKIAYYLPRALLVLVLTLFPLFYPFAPLLWFMLGA